MYIHLSHAYLRLLVFWSVISRHYIFWRRVLWHRVTHQKLWKIVFLIRRWRVLSPDSLNTCRSTWYHFSHYGKTSVRNNIYFLTWLGTLFLFNFDPRNLILWLFVFYLMITRDWVAMAWRMLWFMLIVGWVVILQCVI